MIVSEYTADEWQRFHELHRGRAFAAVDPGKHGAAVVYPETGTEPSAVVLLSRPGAHVQLRHCMSDVGASVAVVEHQWSPRANPGVMRSQIALAFGTGVLLGQVWPEHCVRVWPATWQAYQRGGGRQLDRQTGIELALRVAEECEALRLFVEGGDRKPNKADREGVASAYGIGTWWAEVVRG